MGRHGAVEDLLKSDINDDGQLTDLLIMRSDPSGEDFDWKNGGQRTDSDETVGDDDFALLRNIFSANRGLRPM